MPVGQLLGKPPRRPSRWRAVTRWRDWSLPVKLSAVTLVPIVIALVLGVTMIADQVGSSDGYQRVDRLVTLSSGIRTLTDGLQRERAQTVQLLAAGTVGGSPQLTAARAAVDAATGPYNADAAKAVQLDDEVAAPQKDAVDQLAKLASLRKQVDGGQLDAMGAVGGYSAITGALLRLDTAVSVGDSDNAVGDTPVALHDLQVAKEQMSLSQALVDYGIARGVLAPSELAQLQAAEVRLGDRLADFRAAANQAQRQDFDTNVAGTDLDNRNLLAQTVLGQQGLSTEQALHEVSPQAWSAASDAALGRLGALGTRLGDDVSTASGRLVKDSSTGAGVLAVVLFGALVLAAAVVFLIARQLLRSLKALRASALDVAERQLPEGVRSIQEGGAGGTDIQPVPVTTDDEIGEVARAFDAVHHQALRLATEQAAMRTGYGSVFVNLSRRSQSLVQRQLQLIDRLERDEEDADQLATLFQLDHLATRMRRNNENLLVLSGSEPGRRSGRPMAAADVLRGAVSEIEQYQRVAVQKPPAARVVGYAAGDLTRLLAELLDNATAFSAPETQVTVSTRLGEDGSLVVDILDKGIGMNEAEVAEANARLTEAASVDLATSRRMGLFVVGRLAGRHGIGVSLHGGRDIVGVRATVFVPAELVMPGGPATMPPRTRPSIPHPYPQAPAAGGEPGGLPRRRPVNGSMPAADAPPVNGYGAPLAPRPPSDVEISGTALFSPIPRDEPQAQPPPKQAEPRPEPRPERAAAPEPAEPAEPAMEPEPARGEQLPSGKDLFAATNRTTLSEWWSEAAAKAPVPPPTAAETTPIFDEMLSAWFRSATKPAEEGTAGEGKAEGGKKAGAGWGDFATDEAWRTVQAVSQTSPTSFTDAGLPRRQRGELLLPGSAPAGATQPEPTPAQPGAAMPAKGRSDLPVRDPANVRGRLSSFQQGVHRGRQASRPETALASRPGQEAAAPPARPEQAAKPEQAARPQQAAGPDASPLPRRRPAQSLQSNPLPPFTAPAGAEPSTAAWTFGADEAWRTVQAVSQTSPTSFTEAGLPRRRQGEQLLPGSATGPPLAAPRTERDAEGVRGRLSSFQQGIRRGRHRTTSAAEGNGETMEGE